jgi:uncharacterized protein
MQSTPPAAAPRGDRSRQATRAVAAATRWLHIYLSLFAFATMLLFSLTGLTLNHPDWFAAGTAVTTDLTGTVDPALLGAAEEDPDGRLVDRAGVAAALAATGAIRGSLADVRADDRECTLTWKGPGYAADAVVERRTGRYTLAVTRYGAVAVLNDLHKGRDTGAVWSLVIDVTAILLTLVALTGLGLIFFIRRRRRTGLITALVGAVIVVLLAVRLLG